MIEVNVLGLMVDPSNNSPVVVLKEVNGEKILPIWIGPVEAFAIQNGLEHSTPPRPMTHDLLHNVIGRMGGAVQKIEVNDLKDNTFYALIHVDRDGEKIVIDSRPSDAIALSVRCSARIFVDESVFEKLTKPEGKEGEEGGDKWEKLLANLSPEAFGKYKM
ncbi:MAG: bifunctional nuclease family protein [Deltaproteobacteria bacterium]|nr:bifunctional nuclease family protein [Deltaproteobacteria bacterium]